jgi:hypothetical protein
LACWYPRFYPPYFSAEKAETVAPGSHNYNLSENTARSNMLSGGTSSGSTQGSPARGTPYEFWPHHHDHHHQNQQVDRRAVQATRETATKEFKAALKTVKFIAAKAIKKTRNPESDANTLAGFILVEIAIAKQLQMRWLCSQDRSSTNIIINEFSKWLTEKGTWDTDDTFTISKAASEAERLVSCFQQRINETNKGAGKEEKDEKKASNLDVLLEPFLTERALFLGQKTKEVCENAVDAQKKGVAAYKKWVTEGGKMDNSLFKMQQLHAQLEHELDALTRQDYKVQVVSWVAKCHASALAYLGPERTDNFTLGEMLGCQDENDEDVSADNAAVDVVTAAAIEAAAQVLVQYLVELFEGMLQLVVQSEVGRIRCRPIFLLLTRLFIGMQVELFYDVAAARTANIQEGLQHQDQHQSFSSLSLNDSSDHKSLGVVNELCAQGRDLARLLSGEHDRNDQTCGAMAYETGNGSPTRENSSLSGGVLAATYAKKWAERAHGVTADAGFCETRDGSPIFPVEFPGTRIRLLNSLTQRHAARGTDTPNTRDTRHRLEYKRVFTGDHARVAAGAGSCESLTDKRPERKEEEEAGCILFSRKDFKSPKELFKKQPTSPDPVAPSGFAFVSPIKSPSLSIGLKSRKVDFKIGARLLRIREVFKEMDVDASGFIDVSPTVSCFIFFSHNCFSMHMFITDLPPARRKKCSSLLEYTKTTQTSLNDDAKSSSKKLTKMVTV